ncbi:MAG: hypothetical protein K0B16_03900, partial [Burkholderiaceae bacterium]|nr:hypothetical protein [Burkholderiaceae bacterium]
VPTFGAQFGDVLELLLGGLRAICLLLRWLTGLLHLSGSCAAPGRRSCAGTAGRGRNRSFLVRLSLGVFDLQ